MKATVEIISVKQVKGFIHPMSVYANSSSYSSSRLVSHSYEAIALFVKCVMNGVETSFYSPSIIVRNSTGYLNYKSMDENNWFELIEKNMSSHKGAEMFDGGTLPNVAVEFHSEIKPKIKEGDNICISFSNVDGKIKRVRIINI